MASRADALPMRLAALLSLLPTFALAGVPRDWSETQSTGTRSAPTLSSEGMALSDVVGYSIVLCATTGTLTSDMVTNGSIRLYVRHELTGLWVPRGEEQALPADAVGLPCWGLWDFENPVPRGRLLPAAIGFGASVTLYVEAWAR